MMAKAWMKQDQASQSEALDTWNTLEAEFNNERKAMLMASAETDAIKEEMNKQFGPGTVKYGSEIKQPEIKTPQAIFEFSQRNPAAEGGRQGFAENNKLVKKINPGAEKVFMKSTNDLYEQFGKEVVDAASIQEYGVPFNEYRPADDVKGAKRQNFIRYFKKDMEDYGEYIGTKNPDKDRRTMKRGIRAEKEAATKVKLINEINKTKDGKKFNIEKFLKKNNLTLPELKKEAVQLQRNIYTKRMIATGGKSRSTLKWLTDNINTTDKILETLSKSKLIQNKSGSLGNVMFDAFGREFLKGSDVKNPDYNVEKLNAIKKNLNEYDVLNKYLQDTYGINTQLDHPLSQQTIKKLMNGTAEELSRVNILEQDLNNGFKKTLNDRYLKAVDNNNLVQKRAVEKIAKDLNFNIGSVPDGQFIDVSKIDRGVGSFETLDIKKEMLKSLKNAANLDSEFTKYITANPEVLKDAGINVDTLKEPKNVKNIANNIDEIEKYITDRTGKVKPPSSFIGASSGFNTDLISEDLKKIVNSEGFKTFKAKIANPALKTAVGAAKLPTKIFGAADLVLGYLDYTNNRQKGFSKADSTKHMVDAILFGATSLGEKADIEGVKKIAMQNGMSEEVFNNLVNINTNQKAMINRINESKTKFNESMDIIESGAADPTAEKMLIQKLKVDTKKFLTNTMKDIVDDSRSLNTNLQVQEAGAPININVDNQKAYSDLGSSSREFVQKRIDASDLEKIANQKDTTKGGIGDAVMSGLKAMYTQPKFLYDAINPFSPLPEAKEFFPKDLNYKNKMEQLKKEDPTMYYKMLQSEGVDPRINLNIPVQLEFEQKYADKFGTQLSDGLTQNKAEGGITTLRSKYEYKK